MGRRRNKRKKTPKDQDHGISFIQTAGSERILAPRDSGQRLHEGQYADVGGRAATGKIMAKVKKGRGGSIKLEVEIHKPRFDDAKMAEELHMLKMTNGVTTICGRITIPIDAETIEAAHWCKAQSSGNGWIPAALVLRLNRRLSIQPGGRAYGHLGFSLKPASFSSDEILATVGSGGECWPEVAAALRGEGGDVLIVAGGWRLEGIMKSALEDREDGLELIMTNAPLTSFLIGGGGIAAAAAAAAGSSSAGPAPSAGAPAAAKRPKIASPSEARRVEAAPRAASSSSTASAAAAAAVAEDDDDFDPLLG